jgi:two-component system, NtrC family, nitrogen regulation sensor histidine kinase NtrY
LETRTADEQTAKAASQNGVVVRWDANPEEVTLAIEDEGPGLLNPANVFTPFYTTKPSGSGVGLVLSRQIAEAHGGSIDIANRPSGRGCVVRVILPRSPAQSTAPS